MTEQIYGNYKNIKFFPSNFADYLLSQEIGFSHFYTLGVTQHLSKGFKRPIFLFVKGEFTPKAAQKWSDVYFPSTTPYPRRSMVYAQPMNMRYAPLPSWLSPMPSPYPRNMSQHGTPYYIPQQSDYMPSYDDTPRNHQFAFMSPSSHSSSPQSPSSSSKRSIDDDQHSPSRHHLYHLITEPTKNFTDTQNSND
jgi:7SK snRNA methylphosphate capping enzyme